MRDILMKVEVGSGSRFLPATRSRPTCISDEWGLMLYLLSLDWNCDK